MQWVSDAHLETPTELSDPCSWRPNPATKLRSTKLVVRWEQSSLYAPIQGNTYRIRSKLMEPHMLTTPHTQLRLIGPTHV